MPKFAFSDIRDVEVTFDNSTNGAMSIDAYKAAINKVEEIEGQYFADPTSVSDLAAVDMVITGTSRFKLYRFDLTVTIATGVYAFVYTETVANAESLS